MNSPLTRFINDQYKRFNGDLTSSWGVAQRDLDQYQRDLKAVYKRFLSLACTSTVIGYKARRNEYIHGVIETGYLSIVLTLKGTENPSCVLIRQSIELVLKHIYFSSHPVEYEWTRSREGFRDLTFKNLIEYFSRCEERRSIDPSNNICELLNEWFGKLSRHVHVHNRSFMGYKGVGSSYRPYEEAIVRLVERTREIWPLLIILLICFFPNRYAKASAIEKQLMMLALPKTRKDQVKRYLADHP